MCMSCGFLQYFVACVPVLETELTRLLDKQGTNLFDIFNPEVLPRDVSVLYFVHSVTWPCWCCRHITPLCPSLHAAGLCGDSDGFWFPSSPPG